MKIVTFNKMIARNLKKHIMQRKLSTQTLAEGTGIPLHRLEQCEKGTGTLSINALGKICNYLDIPLSHLIYNKPCDEMTCKNQLRNIDKLFSVVYKYPKANNTTLYTLLDLLDTVHYKNLVVHNV